MEWGEGGRMERWRVTDKRREGGGGRDFSPFQDRLNYLRFLFRSPRSMYMELEEFNDNALMGKKEGDKGDKD